MPLQVLHVKSYLSGNAQLIPAVDLGLAGEPRLQIVHPVPGAQRDQIGLVIKRRARTDKTDVALENAPQLRQFI